jgi:hypothetical protein
MSSDCHANPNIRRSTNSRRRAHSLSLRIEVPEAGQTAPRHSCYRPHIQSGSYLRMQCPSEGSSSFHDLLYFLDRGSDHPRCDSKVLLTLFEFNGVLR